MPWFLVFVLHLHCDNRSYPQGLFLKILRVKYYTNYLPVVNSGIEERYHQHVIGLLLTGLYANNYYYINENVPHGYIPKEI